MEMVEAVAKLGSVSAAANALGLSQPALTQGLQSIEAELGVKLFSRGQRGLEPTVFIRPILSHIDTLRVSLVETVRELQGKEQPAHDNLLRVSAGIRSCKLWVNPALAALRRSDPEIEVIVDSELLRFYDRLINGEVDLGVTLVDLVPESSRRIIIEPLGQWRVLFVCRPDHPLADQTNLTLSQLRAFPLAGHYNYPVVLRLFNEENGDFGRLDIPEGWPTVDASSDSLESLVDAVSGQDCLAIVPGSAVARELEEGSLKALHIAGNTQFFIKLVLVYARDKTPSKALARFIEAMKAIEAARASDD